MATKKKTTTKKTATKTRKPKAAKPKAEKAPRKKLGEIALVMRVSAAALAYIDSHKGDRPRTAYLREVLTKGDAALGKLLAGE